MHYVYSTDWVPVMMQCSFVMIQDSVLCIPPARAVNERKLYNGMLLTTIDSVYRTVACLIPVESSIQNTAWKLPWVMNAWNS